MNTQTGIAAVLVVGLLAGAAGAEEEKPTVDQIVDRANFVAYYQGADGRARVTMNIVDAAGRTRRRELTILRWDAPRPDEKDDDDKEAPKKDERYTGEQKFYVYFHEPADVNDMAFLVHKHLDRDDDRWLYLPKLGLVKRIAGSEKRTSFVGSDFFYEDISGRNPDLDTHELTGTTENYYVLRSTPKDADSVEFSTYKTWIHRKTFLVVKTEYYDRNDKPYRRYEVKAVDRIQDYWTVLKSRMTDLRVGRYTDLTYAEVTYDLGLPEDVFSKRYLKRPPREHLEK
ncbi:MAG: outer membrane lipoprotein-sorting protein [Planctomycetota bacterium]